MEILFIGGERDGEYCVAPVDDDGYPLYHISMPPKLKPISPTFGRTEPTKDTFETYKLKVIEKQNENIRYEYHYHCTL